MANFSSLKTAIQNTIRTNGNNEITGQLLQDTLLSMVVALGDDAINDIASDLNSITSIINNIKNGYVYAGIATPSTTPVSGKVFYVAVQAGTYTYFGSLVVTQGINILKYNGSAWSKEQVFGTNDMPTAGSDNLVKSGGTYDAIKKAGYGSIGYWRGSINIDFDNNAVVSNFSYGYLDDRTFSMPTIVNATTTIWDNEFEGGIYYLLYNYTDSKIYCKRFSALSYFENVIILGTFTYYTGSLIEYNFNIDLNTLLINGRKITRLFGKKISFLGDSITTFEGYIPSGHTAVYPTELSGAGIDTVDKTWWMQLINNTGMVLEKNESWSGTRISTSGPSGYPESSFNAASRRNNLGSPDIIIVAGGTNDFYQNQYGTDLGDFLYSTTDFNTVKFKQAVQNLLYRLQWSYPNADIYIWTPPIRKSQYIFTNNANGWNVQQMNETIKECADFYGAHVLDVYKAFTSAEANAYGAGGVYYDNVHPNVKGMKILADFVTKELLK